MIAIVFIVVFALEVAVIIIGNVFTIYIFWTQRFRLKRTCLLLINLAVADLLIGITEAVALVIHRIPRTEIRPGETRSPMWAFQASGSCASVMFLALISLERVYAVLWPLRHRVTNTRSYIYSIVVVWVAGLCIAGLSLLTVYHSQVDTMYATVATDSFIFISLVVICASYLSIRSRLHRSTKLQLGNERSTEQNLRLSKTFYIVVGVSLLLWLPAFVVYAIKEFCWQCFSPTVLSLVNVLHLANSMVNPFIYSFRMPIFKDALKRCWRKRQRNIELRTVPLHVHSLSQKREFITTQL